MIKLLGSFRLFVVAVVVIAVVAITLAPTNSSNEQRITHLESLVRCPSCDDLSVAESNTASSRAVRNEIAQSVRAGQSDTQILTDLEGVYGPTILLSPDAGGLGDLLWVVPVGVFVVGLVLYGRLVRRRAR